MVQRTSEFVSAGYTVSTVIGKPDRSGTWLRDTTLASDHTRRYFFPDAWAIEWVRTESEERLEHAARIGLSSEELATAIAWATDRLDVDFGAWNLCYELEFARQVARRFFSVPRQILGLGLHAPYVEAFIASSAPRPECEAMGAHVAVTRNRPIEPGGRPVGFEILTFDGCSFNSLESLHLDEGAVLTEAGVSTNALGLVPDLESANRACAAAVAVHGTGWFPWLISEYSWVA